MKIDIVQSTKRYTSSLRGAKGCLSQNYTWGIVIVSEARIKALAW
jgi:hypothetical protein